MDVESTNTWSDLEHDANEQRKQRLSQEQTDRAAAIFNHYGFSYYNLDEHAFMSRARSGCGIDQLMNVTDCYINSSSQACEIKSDFDGYVVTIDLVKHQVKPGQQLTIPVGSVVFVGSSKRQFNKSIKPTKVTCTVNTPHIPSPNTVSVKTEPIYISSPCESHAFVS